MLRPNLLDVVQQLRSRPQMYIAHPTYDAVCAYIQGYDHCLLATGNGAEGLQCFREWIVAKNRGGAEMQWQDLVPEFCRNPKSATDEERCDTLLSLIEEFLADRAARGIQAITDDFIAVVDACRNADRPRD